MGFCYYVIVPKLKLAIEYNKNADKEPEYPELMENYEPDLFKSLKEITIADLGNMIEYCRKVPYIEYKDEFLVLWLEYFGLEHTIIYEGDIENYKGYKIITKQ